MEAFNIVQWNKERYARDQQALQAALDAMGGNLADKIRALHRQQTSIGFIRDQLRSVYRARLVEDPRNPSSRAFMIQYNPARELRRQGAGRSSPPEGYESVNGGCFLCAQNIEWQQCGLEMGYKFSIGENRNYTAWCNPFPFMPNHVTIATNEHKPQTWLYGDMATEASERLGRIIQDLLLIAEQMPNFIVLYNGDKAGASNEKHRHYHAFERVPGSDPFAIEKDAHSHLDQRTRPPFSLNHYPITSIFLHDDIRSIVDDAVDFYDLWEESCGSPVNITANIIGTKTSRKEAGAGVMDLYFVPRNQQFSVSVGRSEVVGGLEVMGEIALSKPEEFARVTSGIMRYDDIVMMLKSVEAPEAAALIQALQLSLRRNRRRTGRRSTDQT